MAIVRVELFSESLLRKVPITCIIPIDKNNYFDLEKDEVKLPLKSLYLLHGGFGSDLDWLSGTRIERYATEHHLAVIMPAGENSFYLDSKSGVRNYGKFIGSELVQLTRKMFPLSSKREDTFIGGLSMGGYGALINGLKYNDTFGKIALLSPALMQDSVINSKYNTKYPIFDRKYYEEIYSNLDEIKGSELDYYALIKSKKNENSDLPDLYVCCGRDDEVFIDENRKYHNFLKELDILHEYYESAGGHDWDFWDIHIKKIVNWLVK